MTKIRTQLVPDERTFNRPGRIVRLIGIFLLVFILGGPVAWDAPNTRAVAGPATTQTITSDERIAIGGGEFSSGVFTNTVLNGNQLELQQTSPGVYAPSGTWESPGYDLGQTSLWGWFTAQQSLTGVTNLLPNGGFETDVAPADTIPDGWSYNPTVAARSTTQVVSGSYSFELHPPAEPPSGGVFHLYSPLVPVSGNRTYHLVTHVAGDVEDHALGIQVAYVRSSDGVVLGALQPFGSSRGAGAHFPDGSTLYHTFTTNLPVGADALQIDIAMGGRGPLWIDDMILAETFPTTLATRTSSDGVAWGAWTAERPFLDQPIALASAAARFVQLRLTLSTPDAAWTPRLSAFELKFARAFPFPIIYGGTTRKFFSPTRDPVRSHGRATVGPDGRLQFADGTPVRFWASQEEFLAEDAINICSLLDAFGFNMVKTQPGTDDDLDRTIDECADRGLYTYLRFYIDPDILSATTIDEPKLSSYGLGSEFYFNTQMIDIIKQHITRRLTHVNPYTGLQLGEDPAVVFTEYFNENGLFQAFLYDRLHGDCYACTFPRDIGIEHVQLLNDQFNAWLRDRYSDRATLETAWQETDKIGLQAAEDPWNGSGTVGRLRYSARDTYSRARFRDTVAFYLETEENYYSALQAHVDSLRPSLGGGAPLTIGTQTLGSYHRAVTYALLQSDVLDFHAYHDHPDVAGNIQHWSQLGNPTIAPVIASARLRTLGTPLSLSEHNQAGYTDFAAEMPIIAGAYGAFHRYDQLTNFIIGTSIPSDPWIDNYDPSRWAQMPVAANLFLRDVAPAETVIGLEFSPTETLDLDTPSIGLINLGMNGYLSNEYALLHGVATETFSGASRSAASYKTEYALPATPTNPYVSDTGQLRWDAGARILTVDTPGTQGAIGDIDGTTQAFSSLRLDLGSSSLDTQSVFVTAVDTADLTTAEHLLLTAVGKSQPPGNIRSIDKRGKVSAGLMPILTTGVAAAVTLPTSKTVSVYALDANGQRTVSVPVTATPGSVTFILDPAYQAVWYELAVANDTTPPAAVADLRP